MTAFDWTIVGIVVVLFVSVVAGLRNSRYENVVGNINLDLPAKVNAEKKPLDIGPLQGQIVNVRWAINN